MTVVLRPDCWQRVPAERDVGLLPDGFEELVPYPPLIYGSQRAGAAFGESPNFRGESTPALSPSQPQLLVGTKH